MTGTDQRDPTCGEVLRRFAKLVDTQDWDGLTALLAPDFHGRWVHTGEAFDADRFVALNRHYPGSWRFHVEQVVDAGVVGVLHARVSDGVDTLHVATFARADGGLLTEITEVWTEAVQPPPERTVP